MAWVPPALEDEPPPPAPKVSSPLSSRVHAHAQATQQSATAPEERMRCPYHARRTLREPPSIASIDCCQCDPFVNTYAVDVTCPGFGRSCYARSRRLMAKKPRSKTTKPRQSARSSSKLQAARERLFELEAGGSAERPLAVVSSAVVETQAESVPCPRCEGRHEVVEHVAVTLQGVRLREARLRCRQCGTTRSLWFRISDAQPN